MNICEINKDTIKCYTKKLYKMKLHIKNVNMSSDSLSNCYSQNYLISQTNVKTQIYLCIIYYY